MKLKDECWGFNLPRCSVSPCFFIQQSYRKKKSEGHNADELNHGIAFAELVSYQYIEEIHIDTDVAPIFKLADLANLYATRLKQLGVNMESCVHSTKLKYIILSYISDMETNTQGRNSACWEQRYWLWFNQSM